MNDFEVVKEHFDILELAKRYTQMRKAGKEFVGLCPLHSENTPSFYVSKAKQSFYCQGCKSGGDVIELVRLINNTDSYTALEMLAEEKNLPLSKQDDEGYARRKEFQKKQTGLIEQANRSVKEASDYLASRGIDQATINRFRVGYGKKNHSLIIPLVDHRNIDIGYAERFIGEPPAGFKGKYRLPSEKENELFRKSDFLYNEYASRLALKQDTYLLIFEGQIDAISSTQIGFEASVACMQSALTQEQGQRIVKLAEDNTVIVLVPDKNKAGRISVQQNTDLLRSLNAKLPIKVMNLPYRETDGKEWDMNNFIVSGMTRIEAETYIDYVEIALIDLMMEQVKDFQLQQQFAVEINSKVDNPFIHDRIVKHLSNLWNVELEKVEKLLKVKKSETLYQSFKDIDQIYDSFMYKVLNTHENNLTLGYEKLDAIINSGMGIPTGWVLDFMARSSVGKTAFALNIIHNAATRHGVGCTFFSFEQQDSDVYPKLSAIHNRISQKKVFYEYGNFNNENFHKPLKELLKNKFLMFDQRRLNLQEIEQAINEVDEHYFVETPCKIILIDYLGYIKANGLEGKYDAMSELTAELKQVAKRTNKLFIVLVQTSRKAGNGSEPLSFADARDSGTIEENADILLGAYRPELNPELDSKDLIEVLDDFMVQVLKNRNGTSGITARLMYDKPIQLIREWEDGEKDQHMLQKNNECAIRFREEDKLLHLRGLN